MVEEVARKGGGGGGVGGGGVEGSSGNEINTEECLMVKVRNTQTL